MMSIPRFGCLSACLFFCAAGIAAPPTDDEIRAAIKQLGHEKFAERERATKLLWSAGPAAEKALHEAIDDPEPEVRRRVRILYDRIMYRIEPGTPPEIIALMERYKVARVEQQTEILREVLAMGSKGHPYLLRWLAVDQDRRSKILDLFSFDDWKVFVTLMAEGQTKIVEELLKSAEGAKIESVVPHSAAFRAAEGKLMPSIAELRASVERGGDQYQAKLLAAMYRQADDADGILWAAERSGQPELVRMVMMQRGQWSELFTRYTPNVSDDINRISGLGLTAAYHRFAGRTADFEAIVKKIQEFAGGPRKDLQPVSAAKVLLILERPDAAMQLLVAHQQYLKAAELLMVRGAYAEGLAMAKKSADAETGALFQARAAYVQLLIHVGNNKEASELLAVLEKDMASSTNSIWLDRQVALKMKLARVDEAERLLLGRIERNDGSYLSECFAAVFPGLNSRSETIWRMLRHQHGKESSADVLKRLRGVEARTTPVAELSGLIQTATTDFSWVRQGQTIAAFEHLAFLPNYFGAAELAQSLVRDAKWEKASTAAKLWLADTLAEAKKWPEAVEAYRKISDADKSAPLPFFLHGWSLTQVGQGEAGTAKMAKAHAILLGSDSARRDFHEALVERGFVEHAAQEVRLRERLGAPGRYNHFLALNDAAQLAQEKGDPIKAAGIMERNLVRFLSSANGGYDNHGAYTRLTSTIHALRAKGFLAAGNSAGWRRELDLADSLHPTNLNTPILLAADLAKAGEKEAADKLFDRHFAAWEKTLRDYPNATEAHNQLAWLSARCRAPPGSARS